jgi:hypothetical protein
MRKMLVLQAVLLSLPLLAFAQDPQIQIVNHYPASLHFIIGINPEVVPAQFLLKSQTSAQSRVLDLHKEAYIRAELDQQNFGFWGVEVQQQDIKIYGYLSQGIAYSWNKNIITFCTPDEYKTKGSC